MFKLGCSIGAYARDSAAAEGPFWHAASSCWRATCASPLGSRQFFSQPEPALGAPARRGRRPTSGAPHVPVKGAGSPVRWGALRPVLAEQYGWINQALPVAQIITSSNRLSQTFKFLP